jgi:hypothetical protein
MIHLNSFVAVAALMLTIQTQAALICDLDATVEGSVLTDSGNIVYYWTDQSGYGNNAGDSTIIGSPLFPGASLSASGLAGVDMLSTRAGFKLFTPAEQDSWLDFNGLAAGNSGFAVFAAFKVDGLTGTARDVLFANNGNATAASSFGLKYENGKVTTFIGGKSYIKGATLLAAGDTVVVAFNYDKANGAIELWDSKNSASLKTNGVAAADFSSTQGLWLGTSDNPAQFMNGMIGEVLVYDEFLDAATFSNKCAELKEKWTVATQILPPAGLTAVGVNTAVVLDWLDDGSGLLDYFTVYKSEVSGTNHYVELTNLTDSSYFDMDVIAGTTYYYAVTATDTNGVESAFSAEVSAVPITVSTNMVLYQHLDASLPDSVTTVSGEVTGWTDQSGKGHDAIDGDGDPVLFPGSSLSGSGLAGVDVRTNRASLELFDAAGTDAFMNFRGGAATNSGFAVLVAFKADSVLGNLHRDLVIGNFDTIASGLQLRYDAGPMAAHLGGVSIVKGDLFPVAAGDTVVFALNYTASNGEMVFWDSKNNNARTNTTTVAGNFTTAKKMRLAGSDNTGQYMDGMIGEVKIFASSLSPDDFNAQRTALASKWGAAEIPKYTRWASGWGVNIGSETNDYDSDELNNLCEYALGGNPTNGTVDPAVLPELIKTGSGFDYVYVQRNDDPALVYTVKAATNLFSPSWTNIAGGVISTNAGAGSFDTVTDSFPITKEKLYIRLTIEK